IEGLAGIARCPRLESLDLWWGSVGDLGALRGLATLRRLSLHESAPFSLAGLEDLALEELDLWLPSAPCELGARTTRPGLRSMTVRGPLSARNVAAIVIARPRQIGLGGWELPDTSILAGLPDTGELSLTAATLSGSERLPLTSLEVGWLGEDGLR